MEQFNEFFDLVRDATSGTLLIVGLGIFCYLLLSGRLVGKKALDAIVSPLRNRIAKLKKENVALNLENSQLKQGAARLEEKLVIAEGHREAWKQIAYVSQQTTAKIAWATESQPSQQLPAPPSDPDI